LTETIIYFYQTNVGNVATPSVYHSNTTGVTCGARTANPSGAPEFTLGGVRFVLIARS